MNNNFQGVLVVQDNDQDSTDLMKCVASLKDKEALQGPTYAVCFSTNMPFGQHDSKVLDAFGSNMISFFLVVYPAV
jgi:hypothetical protein